jgi:hypothetical protein
MRETILNQMVVTSILITVHFFVTTYTFNKDSALLHYSSGFIAAGYVGYMILITIRLLVRV